MGDMGVLDLMVKIKAGLRTQTKEHWMKRLMPKKEKN